MNKYIVFLKGIQKDIASFEFETLWETYFDEKISLKRLENMSYYFESKNLVNKDHPIFKRLTLTHSVSIILCKSKKFDIIKKFIVDYDFSFLDGKKFAVRIKKIKKNQKVDFEEKALAKPIWDQLKKPNVDLENPDYEYFFVFLEKGDIFFTEKLFENDKDYLERMPKFRPVAMPYTLKSDIARVAVNYLGIKEGVVLDPFAGIGGTLLEAIDMGFEIIANDISWNDLQYMKKNVEHYFPKTKYRQTLCDAREKFLKDVSIDGIVTDIPYGRCCRKLGDDLYEKFLENAKSYLKKGKRLVVIYANFVEFKDLALKYFKLVKEVDHYINRSMTRHILVLEKE
jgi:putative methyltransferase (TIGR01177 family)